jgi:hypothetical protein
MLRCQLDLTAPGYSPMTGSCAHDYEPSGFINAVEFLEQLYHYQLPKKDQSPWR